MSERPGYGACTRCGATWHGSRVCHCASCHETFTAVGGFDAHRSRGKCLSVEQIEAKGYRRNDVGHWRVPAPAGTFDRRLP